MDTDIVTRKTVIKKITINQSFIARMDKIISQQLKAIEGSVYNKKSKKLVNKSVEVSIKVKIVNDLIEKKSDRVLRSAVKKDCSQDVNNAANMNLPTTSRKTKLPIKEIATKDEKSIGGAKENLQNFANKRREITNSKISKKKPASSKSSTKKSNQSNKLQKMNVKKFVKNNSEDEKENAIACDKENTIVSKKKAIIEKIQSKKDSAKSPSMQKEQNIENVKLNNDEEENVQTEKRNIMPKNTIKDKKYQEANKVNQLSCKEIEQGDKCKKGRFRITHREEESSDSESSDSSFSDSSENSSYSSNFYDNSSLSTLTTSSSSSSLLSISSCSCLSGTN